MARRSPPRAGPRRRSQAGPGTPAPPGRRRGSARSPVSSARSRGPRRLPPLARPVERAPADTRGEVRATTRGAPEDGARLASLDGLGDVRAGAAVVVRLGLLRSGRTTATGGGRLFGVERAWPAARPSTALRRTTWRIRRILEARDCRRRRRAISCVARPSRARHRAQAIARRPAAACAARSGAAPADARRGAPPPPCGGRRRTP